MKIINKYIGVSLLSLVMTGTFISCDSYLDKLPDNRTELHNPTDVSNLLVSAYSDRHPAYLLEMESDNTDANINTAWTYGSRFQEQAYLWSDITEISDDETPQQLWESYYKAVASANVVIQYINSQNAADYTAQMGEALMCRAYAEFMISTIFCNAYDETTASKEMGVPYPTEPETAVGVKYDRSTLNDLYEKIDADLQNGLSLVQDNYSSPKFHFNRTAAYAFATRFYLYYHKYDKVVEYATKALGSSPVNKLRDWAAWDALSKNKQIQPNAYVNSNVTANFLLQSVYSEWGVAGGPYNYGQKYTHNKLIASTETIGSTGPWGSAGYLYYGNFSNDDLSVICIRKLLYNFETTDVVSKTGYAHGQIVDFDAEETLLCRAEAYALQHQYQNAVDDINILLSKFSNGRSVTLDGIVKFYNNMDYYTPDAPTPKKKFNTTFNIEPTIEEPLLQCILHLRRIITIHEGLRWQDIKRYGIEIYRRQIDSNGSLMTVTDKLPATDPRRAIQLPQDVISAGMTPNPRNK